MRFFLYIEVLLCIYALWSFVFNLFVVYAFGITLAVKCIALLSHENVSTYTFVIVFTWKRPKSRESTLCSTSVIRRDGDSGILEGYAVPAPLVAFVVMVTRVFWKGM